MTTPELPPLPEMESCATRLDENGYEAWSVDARIMAHEARERILLARIAELEADAERYRFLCHEGRMALTQEGDLMILCHKGDVDAAIDAARKA